MSIIGAPCGRPSSRRASSRPSARRPLVRVDAVAHDVGAAQVEHRDASSVWATNAEMAMRTSAWRSAHFSTGLIQSP